MMVKYLAILVKLHIINKKKTVIFFYNINKLHNNYKKTPYVRWANSSYSFYHDTTIYIYIYADIACSQN